VCVCVCVFEGCKFQSWQLLHNGRNALLSSLAHFEDKQRIEYLRIKVPNFYMTCTPFIMQKNVILELLGQFLEKNQDLNFYLRLK